MTKQTKFVWVDHHDALHEFDLHTGEGPIIERVCHDRTLAESSEAVEDGAAQGVVRAYLGDDKHWHFDGYLTTAERRQLDLWTDADERDRWMKR